MLDLLIIHICEDKIIHNKQCDKPISNSITRSKDKIRKQRCHNYLKICFQLYKQTESSSE